MDAGITFTDAAAFCDTHWTSQKVAPAHVWSARAQLKKKRKQGKLNRKRGRR
jgi:hypothetical protein